MKLNVPSRLDVNHRLSDLIPGTALVTTMLAHLHVLSLPGFVTLEMITILDACTRQNFGGSLPIELQHDLQACVEPWCDSAIHYSFENRFQFRNDYLHVF